MVFRFKKKNSACQGGNTVSRSAQSINFGELK